MEARRQGSKEARKQGKAPFILSYSNRRLFQVQLNCRTGAWGLVHMSYECKQSATICSHGFYVSSYVPSLRIRC